MENKKLKAWLCIFLIACIDPVSGKHRLTASCMSASAIGGIAVIFTGGLAALETHQQLHPCNANVPEPSDPNDDIVNGDFDADKGFSDDPMASHPVSDEEASCFMEMDLNASHCAKSHMWNGFKQNEENAGSCFTACIPPSKPDACSAEDWANFNDKTLKKMALYPSFGPDGSLLKTHNGMATHHPKCAGDYYPLGASAVDVTPGNTTDPAPANTADGRKLRRQHRTHKLADKIKSAVHKAVSDVKTAAKKVVTYTKAHATIIKKVVKKVLIMVAVTVAIVAISVLTAGLADAAVGAITAGAEVAEVAEGAADAGEVAEGAADAGEVAEGAADAGEVADGAADAATEGEDAADAEATEGEDEDECVLSRRLCKGDLECMRRKLAYCTKLPEQEPGEDGYFEFEEEPEEEDMKKVDEEKKIREDKFRAMYRAMNRAQRDDLLAFIRRAEREALRTTAVVAEDAAEDAALEAELDAEDAAFEAELEAEADAEGRTLSKFVVGLGSIVFVGTLATFGGMQVCYHQGHCGEDSNSSTPAPTPEPKPCTRHSSCMASLPGQTNTQFCQKDFPTVTKNTCNSCASCSNNGTNGIFNGTVPCGYCGTMRPSSYQVEMSSSSSNATNAVFTNISGCFGSEAPWSSTNIPQTPLSLILNSSNASSFVVYRPVSIEQRWGKYKAYGKVELPAVSGIFEYNTTFKVQPFDCFDLRRN